MTRYRITTSDDTEGKDALASCFTREDAEQSKVALEEKFKTNLIIVEIKGQSDNRW